MTSTALSLPLSRRLVAIPLLGYGFRSFFLAAGLWAPIAMLIWIAALTGQMQMLAIYGAVAWHAHELLFGYLSAALAGFLLTASANWTGRPPVRGAALLALALLWLAGRLALLAVAQIGLAAAMVIDSLFLVVLAAVVGREIVAARNWRNLRIVALVSALALANVSFHVEIVATGAASLSLRIALALAVTLLMVIGGRITPSFTRNWLISRDAALPGFFDRLDAAAITVGVLGLVLWITFPEAWPTAVVLLAAAALQTFRLGRWRGAATWREPLVLILHVGYAFVPLGFLATGVSVLRPDWLAPSAALHAWTAGAIGVVTLAVMTRVSLGHTGRTVTASRATVAIYATIVLAALLRMLAPFTTLSLQLLLASALLWTLGFLTFVACYGPFLLRTSARLPASC
jgi:uncharacterized protein involved in response to NO